jgi:arsenate reductase
MAEAFFNRLARESSAESAGTFPAGEVNPLAVEAMGEVGMDISGNKPKKLDPSAIDRYDRVVSFGCIAKAAFPQPEKLEEWLIDDPAGKGMETFRAVREEIRRRVMQLLREMEG